MKSFRAGLLLEAMESAPSHSYQTTERKFDGGKTTTVQLPKDNSFGKPAGKYITIELAKIQNLQDEKLKQAVYEIASQIAPLIRGKQILVAALGNNDITPDSLGPKMLAHLMVTRPLQTVAPKHLGEGKLRSVAAVCTNVYGATGVESAELIRGLTAEIRPDTVVVIDALATGHLSRLCTTVQISDSGIAPGGGVNNERAALTPETLGVPVISIGMPTVMDGRTLLSAVTEDKDKIESALTPYADSLIATPTQIGVATDNGAKLIAFALNRAFHYELSLEDMLKYLS